MISPFGTGGENNVLQHVATEEGRVRLESGQWRYDYFLKDHLGNVRVMLADNATPLEETHYYPFGLTQRGISTQQSTIDCGCALNKKGFNGNELQNKEFSDGSGLEVYDFNARTYNAQIGRFLQVDPLGEEAGQESLSPYQFGFNSPIRYNDPDGKCPVCPFLIPYVVKGITLAVGVVAAHFTAKAISEEVNRKTEGTPAKSSSNTGQEANSSGESQKVGTQNPKVGEKETSTSSSETPKTKAEQRAEKLSQKPRPGQDFTKAGKDAVIELSKERNNGKPVCVNCKIETTPAQQTKKGVPRPKTETQVDHKIIKRDGGSGTPDNGDVLCSGCNLDKH